MLSPERPAVATPRVINSPRRKLRGGPETMGSMPPPESPPKVSRVNSAGDKRPTGGPFAANFPDLPQPGARAGFQMPTPSSTAPRRPRGMWAEQLNAPSTPCVCESAAAAIAAVGYASPLTGEPQQPTQQPRETRGGAVAARAAIYDRLALLKPHGRVQRVLQLSDDERRALGAEQKRASRARDNALRDATQPLMDDLARTRPVVKKRLGPDYALIGRLSSFSGGTQTSRVEEPCSTATRRRPARLEEP